MSSPNNSSPNESSPKADDATTAVPFSGSSSTFFTRAPSASSRNRGRGQRGHAGRAAGRRSSAEPSPAGRGTRRSSVSADSSSDSPSLLARGRGRGSRSRSRSRTRAAGHQRSRSLYDLPAAEDPFGLANIPRWPAPMSPSDLADTALLLFSERDDVISSADQAENPVATLETTLGAEAQWAIEKLRMRLDDDSLWPRSPSPSSPASPLPAPPTTRDGQGQSSPVHETPNPLNPPSHQRKRRNTSPSFPVGMPTTPAETTPTRQPLPPRTSLIPGHDRMPPPPLLTSLSSSSRPGSSSRRAEVDGDRQRMAPPTGHPRSHSRSSSANLSDSDSGGQGQHRPLRISLPQSSPGAPPSPPALPSPSSFAAAAMAAAAAERNSGLPHRMRTLTRLPLPDALASARLFWGMRATELVPCDEAGTIRPAYKRARIEDLHEMRKRTPGFHWTVRHAQQVCRDIRHMSPADRAGFGDLHKQLRELYYFHDLCSRLFPPPDGAGSPDDMVQVPVALRRDWPALWLPRVLLDFIDGMSKHLCARWRPFLRREPQWRVDSVHVFLEDFSCFLAYHDQFRGQDVVLMQVEGAPGWAEQSELRYFPGRRFRGYKERLQYGLTASGRQSSSEAED